MDDLDLIIRAYALSTSKSIYASMFRENTRDLERKRMDERVKKFRELMDGLDGYQLTLKRNLFDLYFENFIYGGK